jgi:predicted GTPase
MPKKNVLIMGAAGRDFHNFNVAYRQNSDFQVVAFTATQIPNIEGASTRRNWPARTAKGIPIYPEADLLG